jgi:hypothetical protein
MRITRRNIVKGQNAYYVVTRHGRRVEDINYKTEREAEDRATALHEMIKEWDHKNVGCVGIVHTSHPRKIY